MTNPFEFLLIHFIKATKYKEIISAIVLTDELTAHYGKHRYRIYINYEFKDKINETYQSKAFRPAYDSNGNPNKSIPLPFTEKEKLYEEFLNSFNSYFDEDKYVSFDANYYKEKLNELNNMIIEMKNAMLRYGVQIKKDELNPFSRFSVLREKI